MKRRDLLKGLLALPALDWMHAYGAEFQQPAAKQPSRKKLAVILQGPFALVLRKDKGYRVTAFVPKVADERLHHEFRFLSPGKEPLDSCSQHQFELLPKGLLLQEGEPEVDPGFRDVQFSVKSWIARPEDYFVTLDLPRPDLVTYIPPVYPALFGSGHDREGRYRKDSSVDFGARLGSAPLNHVLEYNLRDGDGVRLRQSPAHGCGEQPDQPAWPQKKMLEAYERYHRDIPDQAMDPSLSQRPYVAGWLSEYSHFYFLGVGLPPYTGTGPFPQEQMNAREAHGIQFYNERLLPAIFQRQQVPNYLKLKNLGRGVVNCGPSLRPGSWDESLPRPRLLTVASTENCASLGPVATATITIAPHRP